MTNEKLQHLRHSFAHLLAAAVGELHPDALRTIGPATDTGFYYDFDFVMPISEDGLAPLEKKMREILASWQHFSRKEVTAEEARLMFANNPYKLELIEEIVASSEPITLYTSGAFTDLCKGGHVEDAQDIPADAFALTSIAGAYWRGSEKNKMLTRIYGLAFGSKKELDEYRAMQEEAKKRDHKKLGPALDLFTFSDLVGPGLPLWTPKGTRMRTILDDFVGALRAARGYERVEIPHITKKDLYERSGHWDKFRDELFRITTREEHEFAMKPMNCPHHTQIYARRAWSYRELPQRYANTTMVYRDEQSGELSGLSRVRAITQDDAHVFCRRSQVKVEMAAIWDIITTFYGACGFSLTQRLSLHDPKHPENYLGEEAVWQAAEQELRELVAEKGEEAVEVPGEAAFYGPKIDFMAKDSLGRQWQLATIQLDMNQPERFDLYCINEKGGKERIVMIHAAIMGSIERYLSILIEHYAGAFPLWLAPVQVRVLPIGKDHTTYGEEVYRELKIANIRVELDDSDETLGKKIRAAKLEKIPYLLVIGENEVEQKTATLESRNQGRVGAFPIQEIIAKLQNEIIERR